MKVLNVAASLSSEWGGPTKVLRGLTEALAKKGVKVAIFAPVGKSEGVRVNKVEGVDVKIFPRNFLSRLWTSYSSPLAKALMKEISNFDLIHVHEIWHHPNFVAYRIATRRKIPYVVTVHGALEDWAVNYKARRKKLYMWLIQKQILRKANGLHALTDSEANQIKRFDSFKHIAVIPNGVDTREFCDLPPRAEFEVRYPQLKGKKVVLFLGRIHPIKGLDILAKAFGSLMRGRKSGDVRLVIAGPDDVRYRDAVEAQLKAEGVLEDAIFTGILEGKAKLAAFARADLLVQPSYSEGFSTTILEALACAIPVLVTTRCNFPEIQEVQAGKVIEPDAGQLSIALKSLLNNPDSLKQMGENGKRLVRGKYDWDMIAGQMIVFYEAILR